MSAFAATAAAVSCIIIAIGLIQCAVYAAELATALAGLGRRKKARRAPDPAAWPFVSIIAPAFNEAATIVDSVRSLLALDYPHFEVIVVDDGSRDNTMAVLQGAYGLTEVQDVAPADLAFKPVRATFRAERARRLTVISKENGGKADALNAGIAFAQGSLFCAVDADSLLERSALRHAVRPFLGGHDVMASGGSVRVLNGCAITNGQVSDPRAPRNLLALFQTVEYLRAFLVARMSLCDLGLLTIISGAFGVFDRAAVVAVGGYSPEIVGEDFELVVKLHRLCGDTGRCGRIVFVPDAVCWTEAPERLKVVAGQRRRWQRGGVQTILKHRDMFWRRRHAWIAWGALSQFAVLDILGPLAELAGLLLIPVLCAFGILSWNYAAAFFTISLAFGFLLSAGGLVLEEAIMRRYSRSRDLAWLAAGALLENFGYRQLNTLWRVQGLCDVLRGRNGWGAATARMGARADPPRSLRT